MAKKKKVVKPIGKKKFIYLFIFFWGTVGRGFFFFKSLGPNGERGSATAYVCHQSYPYVLPSILSLCLPSILSLCFAIDILPTL
jgi:hypothetical protein